MTRDARRAGALEDQDTMSALLQALYPDPRGDRIYLIFRPK